MAGTTSGWTDRVTSGLLEALRTREACGIPNPRVIKTEMQRSRMHLEEKVEILKEDIQDIDLAAVKVNIQLTIFFLLRRESPSFVERQARLGAPALLSCMSPLESFLVHLSRHVHEQRKIATKFARADAALIHT